MTYQKQCQRKRKQATVSKTPTGPISHTFDYDYDKVGNLISSVEKDGSGTFIGSITEPSSGVFQDGSTPGL
ncbi:hypothetical protein [Desulfosporosinus youngiae]|uniref:hypothetical protein n=1 Tax=Desulfosporosinus youngiae TaxID=339862 RepID=UPI0005A70A8A|nr:hypothetical protein [Desulfosporosinus youngiae]